MESSSCLWACQSSAGASFPNQSLYTGNHRAQSLPVNDPASIRHGSLHIRGPTRMHLRTPTLKLKRAYTREFKCRYERERHILCFFFFFSQLFLSFEVSNKCRLYVHFLAATTAWQSGSITNVVGYTVSPDIHTALFMHQLSKCIVKHCSQLNVISHPASLSVYVNSI